MASTFRQGSEKAENALANHWGQLIFTHDSKPPVLISKEVVRLGRKEDCDISFAGCKFVSGHHCSLSRDPDGKIWIEDVSTNGSLLNGKKITKNEKIQISHNDQVQIVHRKDPGSDIAFVFQDLKFLREEAALLDNTLEYQIDTEEDNSDDEEIYHREKRSHSQVSDTDDGPKAKKKHAEVAGTSDDKKPADLVTHNSIAETLVCSICQDIFYDCVSLQPCIHSFCAACYSQWMDRSSDCPSCRKKVERISKNHIVNNLVEAFLREHPERQRPEEELREMDSKNKITEDMLRPKLRRRSGLFGFVDDDDEGDEDDDDDDDDDEDDESEDTDEAEPWGPAPTSCKLCPDYISPSVASGACAASIGESASTSTSITLPDYTCSLDQVHVVCHCCIQLMPYDWPDSIIASVPAQKCEICSKHYCHLLFGCRKAGCLGCLNKFKDFRVGETNLSSLINNNLYESKILKDYLTEQSLSKEDLVQKCLQKLDAKEYSTIDGASHNLTSSTVLCYRCALRNLQELAYQFRRDIPRDQLPDAVNSRVDCYWGKNCRTQKTKPLHASRFNHICEQTRFTS
ncbi:E3 ubiquitin-protein ligase CHFR-like isoform X2 [Porites lutea]|uniref:E3 ubiquitin-protein ligase CHFR-like isoform X2 n=1 Tax=Porites lutea TaxID=51062 RepID=UPI003CC60CA8